MKNKVLRMYQNKNTKSAVDHISVRIMNCLLTNRVRNKRGVSEIISTLLLLAITVVGATLIFVLFQSSNVSTLGSNINTPTSIGPSIIITGYDTRDGTGLSGILGLDNNFAHNKLCTISCAANPNSLPVSGGGTDFIVLRVRNMATNTVTLQGISINEITHTWDSNTKNIQLTVTTSGTFPLDGKFSIINSIKNSPTPVQQSSAQLNPDQEVRLVIKLSPTISSDIRLAQPMRIVFQVGSANVQKTFAIPSGDAS